MRKKTKIVYQAYDSEQEQLLPIDYKEDEIEEAVNDLNIQNASIVSTEDGFEYEDPIPQRYVPTKVTIDFVY